MNALEVRGLTVRFPTRDGALTAVAGVDLTLPVGKTLGLVGESGSGKSTVAKAIMGLVPAEAGTVAVLGRAIGRDRHSTAHIRRSAQLVFQDPTASLNPRLTIGSMLREAAARLPSGQRQTPGELLELIGLPDHFAERFPHQLSGGQRQRVAIARALAVRPSILLADEITASLDVSVQASVLNLLSELQTTLGLSYLFISHNLAVVRHLSDEVAIMYLGRIVERGPTVEVLSEPAHPYTRALLDAVPRPHPRDHRTVTRLAGEIPDPRFPPHGCVFHTRCPVGPLHIDGRERCMSVAPVPAPEAHGRGAACHFPLSPASTTITKETSSR